MEQINHHKIFNSFEILTPRDDNGFQVNFIGARQRKLFDHILAMELNARKGVSVEELGEERSNKKGAQKDGERTYYTDHKGNNLPPFDEEYFEWIDLLEAIAEAKDRFVMVELGAGFGRWLMNAVAALRAGEDLPFYLVGVEAEQTHFEWMKQNLIDNHIPASRCRLIHAAISDQEGYVNFYCGNPSGWYGQNIARDKSPSLAAKMKYLVKRYLLRVADDSVVIRRVKSIRLEQVIYDLDVINLVDMDIQGEELVVVENAIRLLSEKVKRVHIGTHAPEIEDGLRSVFVNHGWRNIHDFPCFSKTDTPYGVIDFQDGVQSWINPKLMEGEGKQ